MDPSVSVILTSFNRKLFLENAVKSVLAQSFKNYELIILDNSSTDGTAEYLASLNDKRVKVHIHEPIDISVQRNLGLSMAKSEFIAFLDDDDVWHRQKIEMQYHEMLANTDVALVYSGYRFYSDDNNVWGEHYPTLLSNHFERLLETKDPFCGSASNPMMRKSAIKSVGGYDENVKTGEDWEMYIRLSLEFRFESIQSILVDVRQHRGIRLGDRVDAALATDIIVLDKHFYNMSDHLRNVYYQKIAFKMLRLGNRWGALKYIMYSLGSKPLNIRTYLLVLSIILPSALLTRLNNIRKFINQRRSW
jgi:glycosyltransferase involved in cell wall biosynthesis